MKLKFWQKQKTYSPDYFIDSWISAPDRYGDRQRLQAYNEIYSLFGIALRIAMAVSEVKWRLYKGSERSERNQVAEHPILKLLDYANEFQTGQEIMELTQLPLDLAGKAYWYLPRNGLGVPAEIWAIPPHMIEPIRDKTKFINGYKLTGGGSSVLIPRDRIIYFPMPNPVDPYGGTGFVQPASVEIDSQDYQSRWNRNFFYNSARVDVVLETEGNLGEEEFKRIGEQWATKYQGLSNAHKVAILEGGLKYKQVQNTVKDMDFFNLAKLTRENLMFTFGMPLSVMGITENVNRANAEAGEYTFARWLIKPRLTRIKNKLNEQLIPMFPQAKGIELDFDEVVPETVEMKRLQAESGIRSGFMTVNEARKLNGLDPIPTGDILLQPLNMIPTPASKKMYQIKKSLANEQKESIWRAYAQKTERLEGQFIRILRNLWDDQQKEVISKLDKSKPFDEKKANDEFATKLEPIIQLSYEQGIEGKQEQLLNAIALEWIRKRSLLLAKSINSTTIDKLRRVLGEGFEAGESVTKLAARIRDVYEEADRTRSLMIARTEVITASNTGAEQRYKEDGVNKIEFWPNPGACDECEAAAGEYSIGKGPRPALHPNCRCTILPVV